MRLVILCFIVLCRVPTNCTQVGVALLQFIFVQLKVKTHHPKNYSSKSIKKI